MIDDPAGRIDYAEAGSGPTVVLVPGSCSTGAAWRPIVAQWGDRFRCVTTSLLGYGGTAERRTADDASIDHEVDALEAVIRRAGVPVHLVGHSFGGLVALSAALLKRVPVASLTIIEAPAAALLRDRGEAAHYGSFRQMTDRYFAAFERGEPNAIAAMIDFYGGAGTFASWPARLRDYAIETTHVNILDWSSGYGCALSPDILRAIDVPTLVLWGGSSPAAVQRANELLAECIEGAARLTVAGAAHFMIATHVAEVAPAIARHIESV
ncbi:MAG: alpha/beta hydrolase [Hyphomicrobiaceae bacterium]